MARKDGTPGNDTLDGTGRNDRIDGRGGDDLLRGKGGNDELDGDSGNDTLLGGAGRDTLEGGTGDDVLTGGRGADEFEFERGDGNDRITDFQNGVDVIDLDDFTFAEVQAVIAGAQQDGDDVLLTLSAGTTVRIEGFDVGNLDLSDFTF